MFRPVHNVVPPFSIDRPSLEASAVSRNRVFASGIHADPHAPDGLIPRRRTRAKPHSASAIKSRVSPIAAGNRKEFLIRGEVRSGHGRAKPMNKRNVMKLQRRSRQRPPGALAPFDELSRIRSEINRLFEDPLSVFTPGTSFFEDWEPTLDIYEDRDHITVRAELPGMKKEDFNLSLEGNTLTISGERRHQEQQENQETYRSELYYGRFQRSVTLPQPIDAGRVQ